jgi:hypothetical protein
VAEVRDTGSRGDTGGEENGEPGAGSWAGLPGGASPDELLTSPEWDECLRQMQEEGGVQLEDPALQNGGTFGEEVRTGAQVVGEAEPRSPAETTAPSIEDKPIPDAARLTADEQETARRLKQRFPDREFRESDHFGAEYVDDQGRRYDPLGTPSASKFWNEKEFLYSIDSHLLKSNDFTVIDLTGFTPEQVTIVREYLDALPPATTSKIIRIGF